MVNETIKNIYSKKILKVLDVLSQEERKEIMAIVYEHYCEICMIELNGRKCYCHSAYDKFD